MDDINDKDRLWAALAWIFWPIAIVILLVEDMKTRPFQKYHAVNSLAFAICCNYLSNYLWDWHLPGGAWFDRVLLGLSGLPRPMGFSTVSYRFCQETRLGLVTPIAFNLKFKRSRPSPVQ
jgi:hypothetical protein